MGGKKHIKGRETKGNKGGGRKVGGGGGGGGSRVGGEGSCNPDWTALGLDLWLT
jgi:hypothetical protein